jgi:adenosine deaminase
MTKQAYIETILNAIDTFEAAQDSSSAEKLSAPMHTRLILSVDRRNRLAEAYQVVALASQFRSQGVVGIDLCGDPSFAGIDQFTPVFAAVRAVSAPPLKITLHFGEAEASGSDEELHTLLSWGPERLGHVIHVSDAVKQEIVARDGLGLELCLSCNVHAGMVVGGFEGHHFGDWHDEAAVTVVLCVSNSMSRATLRFGQANLIEPIRRTMSASSGAPFRMSTDLWRSTSVSIGGQFAGSQEEPLR